MFLIGGLQCFRFLKMRWPQIQQGWAFLFLPRPGAIIVCMFWMKTHTLIWWHWGVYYHFQASNKEEFEDLKFRTVTFLCGQCLRGTIQSREASQLAGNSYKFQLSRSWLVLPQRKKVWITFTLVLSKGVVQYLYWREPCLRKWLFLYRCISYKTRIAAFQYLKGPPRELGRDFLQGHGVTGQGGMALNWRRVDLD